MTVICTNICFISIHNKMVGEFFQLFEMTTHNTITPLAWNKKRCLLFLLYFYQIFTILFISFCFIFSHSFFYSFSFILLFSSWTDCFWWWFVWTNGNIHFNILLRRTPATVAHDAKRNRERECTVQADTTQNESDEHSLLSVLQEQQGPVHFDCITKNSPRFATAWDARHPHHIHRSRLLNWTKHHPIALSTFQSVVVHPTQCGSLHHITKH